MRISIDGLVQGVGFRPWVHGLAQATGLRGRVWNDATGLIVEAFGEPGRLSAFVEQLRQPPMPAARVEHLRWSPIAAEPVDSFEITASQAGIRKQPSIPPDLAMCDDCRRELLDPSDRRHLYPFINCTQCGPRYTVCVDVPYDRPNTTMAPFELCEPCRTEYDDPCDRRFHAQPTACPTCGPKLELAIGEQGALAGTRLSAADAIVDVADLLLRGHIVAVKGLGGFHLACDATNDVAVARLRQRKHRDAKPFAVMVADLHAARALAELSQREIALLEAVSRPIVLLQRRVAGSLAPSVAPGNPTVGLMLPYTPLHTLLLAAVGRPLVMTSGNRSDEPMAIDDGEARERLAGIADAFLFHDRAIANRCDDSVARVIADAPMILRRSRGFVPSSLSIAPHQGPPLLATGAHLKNSFCFAEGEHAWFGPHVGDLETDEACRGFEQMVRRFQAFVGITPELIVHDLHPDYFTTQWAEVQPDVRRIAVQHHHAHVASAMAEHGIDGPVIGFAWDGTGYGTDGTAWGGELLVADRCDFVRFATFRPIALAGGERAIRDVWRIALTLLDDAFDGAPPLAKLQLFDSIDAASLSAVRAMIRSDLNSPRAHGVGRYFDGLGALALALPESRYEGEVAMRFGFAAAPRSRAPYPFAIEDGTPLQVDLRSTLRAAVRDLVDRGDPADVSGRFHATLAAVATELVECARRRFGELPVALSGGCFQNARLVEDIVAALGPGVDVLLHHQVPPNDGGIAFGQAVIAAAREGRTTSRAKRDQSVPPSLQAACRVSGNRSRPRRRPRSPDIEISALSRRFEAEDDDEDEKIDSLHGKGARGLGQASSQDTSADPLPTTTTQEA